MAYCAFQKGRRTTLIVIDWRCGSIALRQRPERLIQSSNVRKKTIITDASRLAQHKICWTNPLRGSWLTRQA